MSADATDRLFAERLQAVRNARGLSGKNVAARMGLHERFVHDIERRRRRVSVGEGLALCAVLGVDLAQMLDPAVPVETLTGGAA
ncbi:MAG TPA: helix-turn-helix transcriptional regulator [Nocardioidaceae bacterium]|nr:helix-turn-helix transcriptional regulator [Nocardioidaceae bacterium]